MDAPSLINIEIWLGQTHIELILTMFGEATTTRLTRERDSKEFLGLKGDAADGGNVAGNARKDFEKTLGKSVVSKDNYLDISKKKFIEE